VSTKPKSVVVLPMSYLTIPKPNDYKNGQKLQKGERKQFQSHRSGIVVLRTMSRFTINAIQKSERKNRDICSYLLACEIKPGIHPKLLDASAEELNPPGGKKGVLMNSTATPHMAVHKEREDFEKELEQEFLQSKTG
jgi:hypothetical protein